MEFTDIKLRPERDKRRQKVDFNFDHLDHSSSFYFYLKYEILFLIEAETIIIMKKVHLFIKGTIQSKKEKKLFGNIQTSV